MTLVLSHFIFVDAVYKPCLVFADRRRIQNVQFLSTTHIWNKKAPMYFSQTSTIKLAICLTRCQLQDCSALQAKSE